VDSDTEVEDVKLQLYDRNEAPLESMRLIHAGTQLEDGKKMRDYKIQKESTLHLVLRMAGC
jgi:ubiquitin C